MGRKRTSKKKDLTLWVDIEVIEKLKLYEANKSMIFTDAALKFIEEQERKEKIEK